MSDFEDRLRRQPHHLAAGTEAPPTLAGDIDRRLASGPRPRPRPPVALIAVAAAIVLTAVSVAILAARGSRGHRVLLTQGTSTTASASLGVTPGAPGIIPPVSDTAVPPATIALTVPAVNPRTTAVPPTSATTAATPSTTGVECAASALATTTATDFATYPMKATVTITVKVMNVSALRCQITNPLPSPFSVAVTISGTAGVVWQPRSTMNGVVARVPPLVLDPDGWYTWATVQWNQQRCVDPCTLQSPGQPQVPIGIYQAIPQSAPGVVMPATFTITG